MIFRCRVTGMLLFLFLAFLFTRESMGQNSPGQIKCICIDAGHGGKDPGACGIKSYEKNIVLAIATKIGKQIREQYPGIKVVYTRDKDVFIDLDKRGKLANDVKADLFISIHINSTTSKTPKGFETYVLGLHRSQENLEVAMKENAVIKYEKDYTVKYAGFDPNRAESYIIFSMMQNLYLEKSLQLAALVQEEIIRETKRIDRGVRQAGYLVLKDAAMPAILIEAGFISNPEEEKYLSTVAAQNKIATAVTRAIGKYKAIVEKNSVLLTQKTNHLVAEEEAVAQQTNRPAPSSELFYAIQVASATGKMKSTSHLCHGEKISELITGGRYRYYVQPAGNFNEAKKNLEKVRQKVKDCFIIAVHKGNLISIAEAKQLERNN